MLLTYRKDNKIVWKYEPKQDPNVIPVMCCDTVNRGVAYGDGKIFLHQADTTLVALDAKTGKVAWSVKNGDPGKGATGTSAPLVVKDKVLIGISGGEFGVQCHVTAYDLKTGKQVWRAFSEGPDDQIMVDPDKTTELGKPVGKDSSLKTWQGDQWKIGGGCTWGWLSYDPALNLVYYGSGNPSTWNPKQRPGDNKWSMTIFARNADTGMAKWVYQMTPHDEWDYDGVNEMILSDQQIDGAGTQAADPFRPQRSRLHAGPRHRRIAGRREVRSEGQLDHRRRHEQELADLWPSQGARSVLDREERRGQEHQGHLPGRARHQGPAAGGLFAGYAAVLRADQPRLHGLRAVQGELHRGPALCRRDALDVSASGRDPHGQLHRLGQQDRQDRLVDARSSSRCGPGALATAGDVVFYGTLEGYLKAVDAKTGKELYKFKTPSGIIGNVTTYENGGRQYIAVLSGVGGWAGIGLAAGLTDPTAGLGAVGGYAALSNYTALGGTLTVFALPQ